ncbi:MAG: hypothetical protein R3A47_06040 [Polyangiales bacterium]
MHRFPVAIYLSVVLSVISVSACDACSKRDTENSGGSTTLNTEAVGADQPPTSADLWSAELESLRCARQRRDRKRQRSVFWHGGHHRRSSGCEHSVVDDGALPSMVSDGDFDQTAIAYTDSLLRCADCHRDERVWSDWLADQANVPQGKDLKAHMQRHDIALRQMIASLIRHDHDAIVSAAKMLNEDPIHGDGAPDFEDPPGAAAFAERVHDLAATLAELKEETSEIETVDNGTPDDNEEIIEEIEVRDDSSIPSPTLFATQQARLIGYVIASCGSCHQLVKRQ